MLCIHITYKTKSLETHLTQWRIICKVITYTANGVCPTTVNNNIIFSISNILRLSANGAKLNRHARGLMLISYTWAEFRERKKRQTVATRAMNSAVNGLLLTDRRFPLFDFRFAHITPSCIAYYTRLTIYYRYVRRKNKNVVVGAESSLVQYNILLYRRAKLARTYRTWYNNITSTNGTVGPNTYYNIFHVFYGKINTCISSSSTYIDTRLKQNTWYYNIMLYTFWWFSSRANSVSVRVSPTIIMAS